MELIEPDFESHGIIPTFDVSFVSKLPTIYISPFNYCLSVAFRPSNIFLT